MHADIVLAQRLGRQLPPASAFNEQDGPTRDPFEVLQGAIAPWGGYKGFRIGEYGSAAGCDGGLACVSAGAGAVRV
ncbi:hypothetical protein BJX70DRAFT_367914 [Aspergillus crustosus]